MYAGHEFAEGSTTIFCSRRNRSPIGREPCVTQSAPRAHNNSLPSGQDEGGIQDRLSPAFWGESVDFTTNHSWWQNDYVLWDSLAAKQPGEAMLIQETGLQRELNLDEVARRTPESEAALLERKIAASFIQGSGAIEWLWNTQFLHDGEQ